MSFFSDLKPTGAPCTTFVHRPAGGIAGFREVFDEASRIAVTAFPMTALKNIALGTTAVTACYILADHERVYIGESGHAGRRLSEHATDPSKSFARKAYVISGGGNASFDKTAALYFQLCLILRAPRRRLAWSRSRRVAARRCWTCLPGVARRSTELSRMGSVFCMTPVAGHLIQAARADVRFRRRAMIPSP
jgi:hypothetical protein